MLRFIAVLFALAIAAPHRPCQSNHLRDGARVESRLALGCVIIGGLGFAKLFTLFLTPIAFRILAPLSKPRAHETQLLVEELKAAPRL